MQKKLKTLHCWNSTNLVNLNSINWWNSSSTGTVLFGVYRLLFGSPRGWMGGCWRQWTWGWCCCYWRRNSGRCGTVGWGGHCWRTSIWRTTEMIGLTGESHWSLMGAAGWGGHCWMTWMSRRLRLGGWNYCVRTGSVWCSGHWWRMCRGSYSCPESRNRFFSPNCPFQSIWEQATCWKPFIRVSPHQVHPCSWIEAPHVGIVKCFLGFRQCWPFPGKLFY